MRRPAPLPEDPDTPRSADVVVDEEKIREEPEPRSVSAAAETSEEPVDAELLGSWARSDTERSVTVAPEPPAVPEEVGVREVWAAARARRKALRAEVRRFTVRQRRRRWMWLGLLGAVVALVVATVGVAYSPLFAVERVRVTGTDRLDAVVVESALSGQLGVPLAAVDSSQVKAALIQFPLVESYTLEARPPHELLVRIVERTPIGSIQTSAGHTLVDAAGVALSTTPAADDAYPLIDVAGGVNSAAFAAIGTVFRSLPEDVRAQVTAMSATSANDVTLTLGGTGTQVVWGNADRSAYKAEVLAQAMAARPPSEVWSYDVSAPDVVVVR